MTLAHGTDRLESARLVLRVTSNDLPFLPLTHSRTSRSFCIQEAGRSPEETAHGEIHARELGSGHSGYLAVLKKTARSSGAAA
jgi:hypothetical protein